jgi:hypothetical protein
VARPETASTAAPESRWSRGRPVAVRNRFTGGWATGFRIEESEESSPPSYRLRRLSDNAVLPAAFPADDLRPV